MEANNVDLYKLLGVSPRATPEEIKAAYKSLSLQFHPDKRIKEAQAHCAVTQADLNHAKTVLLDPQRRKDYDEQRVAANKDSNYRASASPPMPSQSPSQPNHDRAEELRELERRAKDLEEKNRKEELVRKQKQEEEMEALKAEQAKFKEMTERKRKDKEDDFQRLLEEQKRKNEEEINARRGKMEREKQERREALERERLQKEKEEKERKEREERERLERFERERVARELEQKRVAVELENQRKASFWSWSMFNPLARNYAAQPPRSHTWSSTATQPYYPQRTIPAGGYGSHQPLSVFYGGEGYSHQSPSSCHSSIPVHTSYSEPYAPAQVAPKPKTFRVHVESTESGTAVMAIPKDITFEELQKAIQKRLKLTTLPGISLKWKGKDNVPLLEDQDVADLVDGDELIVW